MIDVSKLFDSYSRQARLFPGLLTLFPIILTAIAPVILLSGALKGDREATPI